jgi:acyl carrier protein
MRANDTLESVRELMIDVFDADDLVISDDTTADDVEGWDSLHHIRLIVAVERRFKIKFENSEVESLKNVGDLVRMVDKKVRA